MVGQGSRESAGSVSFAGNARSRTKRMRKRRQRSTWFPVLGTSWNEGDILSSIFPQTQEVALNWAINTVATPLIPDYTEDPSVTAGESTLRDFVEGQTCIIDRIVGKICVLADQTAPGAEGEGIPLIFCCAGIAVLPVDDSGTPLTSSDGREIAALAAENLDKPFLWRRTWLIGNRLAADTTNPYPNIPTSNMEFGSVLDGPHVDTKGVKRAIQRNQRLFLILSTQDAGRGEPNVTSFVRWVVDLRVLGRMRRARNKSLFT